MPFALTGMAAETKPKGPAALAAPAAALAALDLVDVRPAAEMPIPAAGVATAAFTTFDGVVIGLRLLPAGDGEWAAIDATGFDQGVAEAKALSGRLSRWSFALPPAASQLLRTGLADLVQPASGS
jgi:2-keto-4-pentenoate hydratase